MTRTCAHPPCRTVLSRYNRSPYCYLHESLRRLAPATRTCPACGAVKPFTDEHWVETQNGRYRSLCRDCSNARRRAAHAQRKAARQVTP